MDSHFGRAVRTVFPALRGQTKKNSPPVLLRELGGVKAESAENLHMHVARGRDVDTREIKLYFQRSSQETREKGNISKVRSLQVPHRTTPIEHEGTG